MRDVKRGALTAAVGAVVVVLAGCGAVDSVRYPYAKESADKIWSDALTATREVTSLRVSGVQDRDGEPRIAFNMLNAESGRCGGTMSFSTAEFDVVLTAKNTYLKGSVASWQQLPGISREQGIVAGPLLADRWVETTPVGGADPDPLCRFVDDVLNRKEKEKKKDGGSQDEKLTNEGLTEAAGIKAVRLEAVDDKRSIDVWVDVEEPHYIVKMVVTEEKGTTEVVLSDFNFAGDVELPKKKDIFDPADVSGRSG